MAPVCALGQWFGGVSSRVCFTCSSRQKAELSWRPEQPSPEDPVGVPPAALADLAHTPPVPMNQKAQKLVWGVFLLLGVL